MDRQSRLFLMSASNYFTKGIFATLLSVLAAYYMGDVGMSTGLLGIIFSIGGILTALAMTIPGRIIDRIGAKNGLIMTGCLELVSFILFPMSHSPYTLIFLAGLNELAVAFSTPCNTQILSYFKVENPERLLSFNMISTSVSSMITSFAASRMIENFGLTWRMTYIILFVVCAVIAVIGLVCVFSVDYDYHPAEKTEGEKQEKYVFTAPERKCSIAISMIYAGYMGVGIALSIWLPTLLSLKGFDGVTASKPNTVASVVQLICYFFMPVLAGKMFRSFRATPIVRALNILCIFGMLASESILVITFARALLAVVMSFLFLHIQTDLAAVAPGRAAGRFASVASASANAAGARSVTLIGVLPGVKSQLVLLLILAVTGVAGGILFIKPATEIVNGGK